jgi:hypothetical protein
MLRHFRSRHALVALPLLIAGVLASSAPMTSAETLPTTSSIGPLPTLVVATPSPIFRWVVVPDCHYMSQSACATLLAGRGLQIGTISFLAPQDPPPYVGSHIVSQTPLAGQFTLRGSAVDITMQPFGNPFQPFP